jgi:DNA-binding CsgD family transcriptional regulator
VSLGSTVTATAARTRSGAPEEEAVPTSAPGFRSSDRGANPLAVTSPDPRLGADLASRVGARVAGSDGTRGAIGAETAGERASLVDAVHRMERARETGRRCDSHEALQQWRALVGGQWSIVATCAAEGRRMILGRRIRPGTRDPRTLSPRVRDVIGYAAMGHSNKLIAYVMGISAPAVAKHLRRAQKTIGVSTRRELIALFDGGAETADPRAPAKLTPELPRPYQLRVYRLQDSDGEFVLFDWPIRQRPLPRSLTSAEREVVRRALAGESNPEIARGRGTSTRTVANQMASVFRKLGVGSRLELFALLGGG